MKISVECQYCGHVKLMTISASYEIPGRCNHGQCDDPNLTIKDLSKTKIDYYKGSPPFPEKEDVVFNPFSRYF